MLEDGHEPNKEIYNKLIESLYNYDEIEQELLHSNKMLGRSIYPSTLAIYQNWTDVNIHKLGFTPNSPTSEYVILGIQNATRKGMDQFQVNDE